MRTLAAYLVGAIVVLAVVNGVAWFAEVSRRHDLSVFSFGFVVGAFGMLLAAHLYGYRKIG